MGDRPPRSFDRPTGPAEEVDGNVKWYDPKKGFGFVAVAGSKDVSLHAGELTVEVGDREAYARVDATVITGEVDASAFGESHGGLFRSFHHAGQGTDRLHVHVGAGQINLR